MIVLILISIVVIIGIGVFCINKKSISTNHPINKQYFAIESYLYKNLNLEESFYFVDLVRKFNLNLITYTHSKQRSLIVKNFTSDLLGLILKIPRMEENSSDKDIITAIKQISIITETTLEIQQFLIKNLPSLKKHLP